MASKSTLLWYDFETFGVDPRRDRPVQFAAVRTDMDLNIVDDPVDILCRPTPDCLPDPMACLITGISPMDAFQRGIPEHEFTNIILREMNTPNTCTLGYNTIRFDDEVTRFMLYRNLFDPYEREWKNGNSRWDLLDVVRMTWALKPETLHWPKKDTGQVSFKLDQLTPANNIGHEQAHDALSDVYATIELARLIKQRQPKLFDYAFGLRKKNEVLQHLDLNSRKPVLHISGRFPVEQGCMAMVCPVAKLPDNPNGIICVNLSQSPELLERLSVEEIRERLFSTRESLEEKGLERIGLKVIHINKSPMILPPAMLTEEVAKTHGHQLDVIRTNYEQLRVLPDLAHKLSQVFMRDELAEISSEDVDTALYIEFIPNSDKQMLAKFKLTEPFSVSIKSLGFQDQRLPELAFRYWCRNWPEKIPDQQKQYWLAYCQKALTEMNVGSPRTLDSIRESMPELIQAFPDSEQLLRDIEAFIAIQAQNSGLA